MASRPGRQLTGLFIRGYLHPDTASAVGENQNALATAVALLVSPGLFVTVIMAAKYVLAPFPNPAETALSSLFDHLLFFCTSWTALALMALFQWDRLALDSRDANVLGVLPIPTRRIVRAKWIATGWLALVAATVLNALPSLIYPLVSVARLDSPAVLVLWLAVWHFVVAILAGVTGFLGVLLIREALWACCGPRWFGAVSAGVQALLVVMLVAALFLLPPLTADALRSGNAGTRWLPPVAFAALFEAGAGHLIVDLPSPTLPPAVRTHARRAEAEYRSHRKALHGVATGALVTSGAIAVLAVLLAAWNGRRLPPSVSSWGGQRRWSRLVGHVVSRFVVRRPAVQAGFFLALRTLTRSQPHRLVLAVALAVGLAAGAVGVAGQPEPVHRGGVSLAGVPVAFLAGQHLLLMSLAAGIRVALRYAADTRASWIFALAWNADHRSYASGVALGGGTLLGVAILVLVPVYARFADIGGAVLHAACGIVLGLVLLELVLLIEPTVPLTTSVPASDLTKALVPLGVPTAVGLAIAVAALERAVPVTTIALLAAFWCLLHFVRRVRQAERRPWRQPSEDEMHGLGVYR